jgi:hypothetical protein
MTLRSDLIRLAYENPEMRPHLLPMLRTAKLDVYDEAGSIVQQGYNATGKKLSALVAKAGRAMKPKKFILDPRKSGLNPGDGGSDGPMAFGQLFFTDEGDTYRTEQEARKIFDEVLGAWPSRQNDGWIIHFDK